jgi:hypothetical protein
MEHPRITSGERLQIAIDFARMDLDTLRPGDWLNIRDDLATFLGCKEWHHYQYPAMGWITTGPDVHPNEFAENDLRALQAEVRRVLQGLVSGDILGAPSVEIRGLFGLLRSASGAEQMLIAYGPTRDMFLITLLHLLNQEPLDRIRGCPECGAIFYRIAKQQYCSRPCTNRANIRNWRQREEVKEGESEKAHQRYAAKRIAEDGTPLKVTRRPRKQLPT